MIGGLLKVADLIIVIDEIFVHGVVELEVADSAGSVARLDRNRPVGLEIDTIGVNDCSEKVVPVLSLVTLEEKAVPGIHRVGRTVGDLIEIESLHSVGGIHKCGIPGISLRRSVCWAERIENCWALSAECDSTPEPWDARASLDTDVFGEPLHVRRGGRPDGLLGDRAWVGVAICHIHRCGRE